MKEKINKKLIIASIITVLVVGLLSLIPYTMIKNAPPKEFIVGEDNKFELKQLSYKIPEEFEGYRNRYDDYRTYSYNEDDIYCSITVDLMENRYKQYKTGEEYLKNDVLVTLEDKISDITQNNDWYTMTVTSKTGHIEKVSAYVNKDDIYIVKYSLSDYQNGEAIEQAKENKCMTAYDYVYESLKLNNK